MESADTDSTQANYIILLLCATVRWDSGNYSHLFFRRSEVTQ